MFLRMGARWKVLSEEDKQPFLDANAAAKTEYEKAMEEYYAENPDKKPVEVKKEKKEKVAGGGTKKKKGFQADTDAETAFESELPKDGRRVLLDILVALSRAKMANRSSSRLLQRQSQRGG